MSSMDSIDIAFEDEIITEDADTLIVKRTWEMLYTFGPSRLSNLVVIDKHSGVAIGAFDEFENALDLLNVRKRDKEYIQCIQECDVDTWIDSARDKIEEYLARLDANGVAVSMQCAHSIIMSAKEKIHELSRGLTPSEIRDLINNEIKL